MPDVRLAHTSQLDAPMREALRALLDAAFEGDFSDDDWLHCLGGMHALAYEGDDLVGHAALVDRELMYQNHPLRTGYVEGVGVRADRRRHGHASALMAMVERMLRAGYDVGALSATDEAARLYAARGWKQWKGPTAALTPEGPKLTPEDDGSVYVFPVKRSLDLTAQLTCDWRHGDLW